MMRSVCACVVFSYSFRLEDEKSSIISLFKHACIKMCGVDFLCNAFFPFLAQVDVGLPPTGMHRPLCISVPLREHRAASNARGTPSAMSSSES